MDQSKTSYDEEFPCLPGKQDYRVKYKTEICRNFQLGHCTYGSKCAFAHGERELREGSSSENEDQKKP